MCDVRAWGCLLRFNTWRVRVGSSMCERHMRYKNLDYPKRQNCFPVRCSWPRFTFILETSSTGLQAERESTFMNTFSTKTFPFLSPWYYRHGWRILGNSAMMLNLSQVFLFLIAKEIPRYAVICSSVQRLHLGQREVTDAECWGQFPDTVYLFLFKYTLHIHTDIRKPQL